MITLRHFIYCNITFLMIPIYFLLLAIKVHLTTSVVDVGNKINKKSTSR